MNKYLVQFANGQTLEASGANGWEAMAKAEQWAERIWSPGPAVSATLLKR